MDDDGIRLTSYFREGQRVDGRPLADALAGLYSSPDVAASIVLRGIEGPVTAIVVGFLPGIEAMRDHAAELTSPGLVTIERTRLLTGDIMPVWLGVEPGQATKLTVYCGSQDQVYQVPAFEVICELLHRRGIAGASVVPGVDGTSRGQRQRQQFLRHDSRAPLMVVAVDPGNKIGVVLPELGALFRHPVMTVEKVQVCKRDGQLISRPQVSPAGEWAGMVAQLKLTVYTSEAARHDGQPVHRAIARQLGQARIAGVTILRGTWGFHADHAPHGDHFPRRGRHVPVVTTVIGVLEQISEAFDVIDALTAGGGLITAETVLVSELVLGGMGHGTGQAEK